MRDNWICVEGRWLNLDAIRDIYVKYVDVKKYAIFYSCNPYDRDLNYQTIGPVFDSEEEAQEYLDNLLQGNPDE